MILDKQWARFSSVRAALSLPLVPLQYIVNFPTEMIDQLKAILSTHDELVTENLRLKAEQLLLKSQLQRSIAIESENNYMKALFQSSREIKGKSLIAEILAVHTDPFINQVVINKGSNAGVYNGQPVLDATGIMGQVIQVGPLTSRILLINDPHSGVAVQNARNGVRAVAVGDSYSSKLRLMYVPQTADIKVGDIFITSGLGDHYPEGYPVGKVLSVTKDPSQQFSIILMQPSARLESSREVLLIWDGRNV
jgi:rod shape-determining protein MreC